MKTNTLNARLSLLLATCLLAPAVLAAPAGKSVLLVAGPPSHGPGEHEHPAGCELLAMHLNAAGLGIAAEVSLGWPADPAKVAAADSLVIFGDGGGGHPARGHLDALMARHRAGKGLAVLHWALGPTDAEMKALLMEALGGQFESGWSVNPIWTMSDPVIAAGHPATRGVAPFGARDEWYFHIRLRDDVTPLLRAHPPTGVLGKKDGPYSGNPAVRKALAEKVPQTLAWTVENDTGSRGFGFTGGHFQTLWSNDDCRRLVLNGIAWTAGVEIPESGVAAKLAVPDYESIDRAIARAGIGEIRVLLSLHPDWALKGAGSRTPLDIAILRNKGEIAALLLAYGANPNGSEAATRSPLHLAVNRKNADLVAVLLKAGARPDRLDKSGWTPLHHAAAENQLEIAKVLLDGGADPTTLSELGGTPLHEAAASGSAEMIQLLLAHKVDPAVKSKQGVTALDIARKYKNQPAIDVLSGL